jgi:hypothetical protein
MGRMVNVEPDTSYVPVFATNESKAGIFSAFVGSSALIQHRHYALIHELSGPESDLSTYGSDELPALRITSKFGT